MTRTSTLPPRTAISADSHISETEDCFRDIAPFQSAYCSFHSIETALLKVHNDLCAAMERGQVTSLILLDLSAAFDTVDHSILLNRLSNWFGLDNTVLNWFSLYLSFRLQAVTISDSFSSSSKSSSVNPFVSFFLSSDFKRILITFSEYPFNSSAVKNLVSYC